MVEGDCLVNKELFTYYYNDICLYYIWRSNNMIHLKIWLTIIGVTLIIATVIFGIYISFYLYRAMKTFDELFKDNAEDIKAKKKDIEKWGSRR